MYRVKVTPLLQVPLLVTNVTFLFLVYKSNGRRQEMV